MSDLNEIIQDTRRLSIQSQLRQGSNNVLPVFWQLVAAGDIVPPWWSPQRDVALRKLWKRIDYLSGAIYTMEARMSSIDFRIEARDQTNDDLVAEAEALTDMLYQTAQAGEGWVSFYSKFVEDLYTQDNGAFAEVIGQGSPDGPIIGTPISVVHLDSGRCRRSGDPLYPVLYLDLDGKWYKLHYSRVLFMSQMSSPIAEMYGVGFCAVSRVINIAQTLYDIITYKQEKLGSRPLRAILIPRGGLDPTDVQAAWQLAESSMDSMGLSRYSKIVLAGDASLPDADVRMIELSSLPDGFDEQSSIMLGMATIALGFGVDARELFPSMSLGATRADALLSHLKQRGKGPGQIIQATQALFNAKVLPPSMRMVIDFQDDVQDRQAADIKLVRANRRAQDIDSGLITSRTARLQMLSDGDLTRSQFEIMELEDGRLPDGSSVLTLFYKEDSDLQEWLDLGGNPLDVEGNDRMAIFDMINDKKALIYRVVANENNHAKRKKALQAIAALNELERLYRDRTSDGGQGGEEENDQESDNADSNQEDSRRPRRTLLKRPVERRQRRRNVMSPNPDRIQLSEEEVERSSSNITSIYD